MAREFRFKQGRKAYTYSKTYIHTYEPRHKAQHSPSEIRERSIDKIIMEFRMGLWRKNLLEADIEHYNKRLAQLDSLKIKLEDAEPNDYSLINEINHKIRCIREDFERIKTYCSWHSRTSTNFQFEI